MATSAGGLSASQDSTTDPASGLQPPTHGFPRMPFSSPISEEIISPLSPIEHGPTSESPTQGHSDPFASPLPSQNPFVDVDCDREHETMDEGHKDAPGGWAYEASRAAARSASAKHSRRFSVVKPRREASRTKQLGRTRRPGITVITDFSQHRRTPSATEVLLAKRSMTFPQHRPAGGAGMNTETTHSTSPSLPQRQPPAIASAYQRAPPSVGFVSLADLKAIDAQAWPSKGLKWPRMGREPKPQIKAHQYPQEETAGEPAMLGNRDVSRVKGAGFKTQTMRPNRQDYSKMDGKQESPSRDPSKQIMDNQAIKDNPKNGLALDFEGGGETSRRLRPPPIKLEEDLSPFDRPIVIGLSVPSARLEEHTLSPQSASVAESAVGANAGRARAPSDATSVTPTIIITPAREKSGWSMFAKTPSPPSTRRIASSIYSQPTPYIGGAMHATNIPPMPTVPASVYRKGQETNPINPKRNELRDSANTLFEEDVDEKTPIKSAGSLISYSYDYSPRQSSTRGRSSSGTNALSPGNRSSVETTATRHRSHGWWNFITTPFVTRSNTASTKGQVAHTNQRPEVPSLAQAADRLRDYDERDEKVWDKQSSPASAKPKSGHTTMWTDLDWWEEDREKIGVAVDHTPRASVSQHQPRHKAQDSSATIPFMIAGGVTGGAAAVEYCHNGNQPLGSNNPFNLDRSLQQNAQVQSGVSESRQSQFSSFSPNDREVPMLFEGDHYAADNHNANNPFYQAPSDPFASSFRQVAPPTPRPRPDSGMTEIEVEDEVVVSPTVHEARVAPVLVARPPIMAHRHTSDDRALSIQITGRQPDTESSAPPPYSPPRRAAGYRPYVAVYPPAPQTIVYQQPLSPGPMSPGLQRAMSSRGGIPMAEVASNPAPAAARHAYITNQHYSMQGELPPRPKAPPVTLADLETPADLRQRAEARPKRREKEDALATRVGGLWRGRGCFSANGCAGRGGAEGRKRRRWCCCITFSLVVMIVIIIVLAMTLHRKGDNTPVQTQWLNNTGFPPMPTGISTIARPDAVVENTGCVHPSTMWSCALPKEQQQSVAPNAPNQPNFRLQIRFRNDSSSSNTTSRKTKRHLAHNPVSAGKLIRHRLLHARDVFSSTLWSPSPSPPTIEEQRFLGNTTDGITNSVFEGESTPFYITFLPITPSPSRLIKRQGASPQADPFPDLTSLIPPPSLNPGGTPKPAILLPLPESQPLRLYDRGLQTEHYGFYNYFDRSIFLKSVKLLNDTNPGEVPADMDGGATAQEASVQCTWAQTRFLVKIWTRMGDSTRLLQNPTATTTSKDPKAAKNTTTLSANDFSRPGSFPYPVSITLDRHGGALKEKMVYCYGLDERGKVVPSNKKFQIEERGFGGVSVNGADGPWGNVTISVGEGGPGGVDGGDGGCGCEWRNWVRG